MRMGSQISSIGRSIDSQSQISADQCYHRGINRKLRRVHATNTNAREHGQPDRLKLLFRDQRGYRALSEQKVHEWLSKNKQFYTVMPKDLVEIPEQIFCPPEPLEKDLVDEESHSHVNKSEQSGHNASSNGYGHSTQDDYHLRRNRDKMNHYMPKSNNARHHTNHSSNVHHRSDVYQSKFNKPLKKNQKDSKPIVDCDVNRTERSTTTAESLSTRMMNKEVDKLTGRNQRLNTSRRDSHSLAHRTSLSMKRQSESMHANNSILPNRRTLPGMFQNNALIRQRLKLADSCMEPVRSLQHAITSKRSSIARRHGLYSIPKRERVHRLFEMTPMGRDCSIQEARNQLARLRKASSQSVVWQSPSTLKRLRNYASIWMNE